MASNSTTAGVRNGILQAVGILALLALLGWAGVQWYNAAHREQWERDAAASAYHERYVGRVKAAAGN